MNETKITEKREEEKQELDKLLDKLLKREEKISLKNIAGIILCLSLTFNKVVSDIDLEQKYAKGLIDGMDIFTVKTLEALNDFVDRENQKKKAEE